MLFWPIYLTGLILIAFFLSGSWPHEMLRPGNFQAQYIYLVLAATGVLFGAALRIVLRSSWRGLSLGLCYAGAFSFLVFFAGLREDMAEFMVQLRTEATTAMVVSEVGGVAELKRGWDGHYRADFLINDAPVRMMVDTGASIVLIPYESAEALGIDPAGLRYNMPVTTANGQSTVAPVRLASIQIGSIRVHNIEAAVAHPGRLSTGLMGMSFLDRLHETSFRGQKLILRQNELQIDGRFRPAPKS